MASIITHIVFAIKIFFLLPNTIDIKEFIVGTSFPDIRYLAHLDRKLTHIEPVSWHDIINEKSSFKAGMLFHNFLDIIRMLYFEPCFYDRYFQSHTAIYRNLFPMVMKIAEDVVLYDKINNWSEIMTYFETTYPSEKLLCCEETIINKWHNLIINYCMEKSVIT